MTLIRRCSFLYEKLSRYLKKYDIVFLLGKVFNLKLMRYMSKAMDNKNYDKGYICKDPEGNILLSVDSMDESGLNEDPLLTHCLAVVKIGNEYLLGWNKWRNRFEIFGGCKENGETARECIIRECNEELGFTSTNITYIGAMRLLLKPDYFSQKEREEVGGLYGVTLPDISLDDLFKRIKDKEEITRLALYSQVKETEPIAMIDELLLEYYR